MELYYATFTREGTDYVVDFPDLGISTFGGNMHEALYMAKDMLASYLVLSQDDHDEIPEPSEPNDIKVEQGQLLIPIEVDLALFREKEENKLVKKNVNIPSYLNRLAIEQGINFSQTLTEALTKKIHV